MTTKLLDRLRSFFDEEEWPYEDVEGPTILHLVFRSEHTEFDCYAQTIEEATIVLFYSIAPFQVAEDDLDAAAEFVTRANHGLPIGNFELDYDSGEARFKTSIDVAADELTTSILRGIVGANLAVMERYLPGLRAVVFAGASAEAVVAELDS